MSANLTNNAIEKIMSGEVVDKPVFQVLGHKKIAGSGGSGSDRYRLLLSDGVFSHSSAMLATQLNDKILSGEIDMFTVIMLDKYLCNPIQPDRRVMILLEVTVVTSGKQIGQKIGNPVPFKLGQTNNNPAPAQPQVNGGMGNKTVSPPPAKPVPQHQQTGGAFYGNQKNTGGSKPYSVQNVPNTPGGTPAKVHPINSLTPYQNRWTIRARVTQKSNVRTWSNSRGEGKLFSMNLLDSSGEIKATAFRDQVDKFYDVVEINKVYYVRKGQLKTADKRYSSVNNEYEMTFSNETEMIPCDDDDGLPTVKFSFVPINQMEQHQANAIIDVLGVVKSAAELSTVTGKQSNREIKKRDITIVDESKVQIRMTLWGSDAESFDAGSNAVVAVKGAKLSDWGGRSLSALASSQIILNPDISEAHHLRGWYESEGHCAEFGEYRNEGGSSGGGSGTNWKTFKQVKNEGLGHDKADYFTTKATIMFLKKENSMYMACPTEGCNKKLVDLANGLYRCEKCSQEVPNYKWRLILSCNLSDYTDNQWVTFFQETAETVLGKPSEEIGRLKEQDENGFEQLFQEAHFKSYLFKCRAKMETYNDESRLKTVCVQATPIDYPEYNRRIIANIEQMLGA